LAGVLGVLQSELRTREARGEGTDVRLVLIEAATVRVGLRDLDRWLSEHIDGIAEPCELYAALTSGSPAFDRLGEQWHGLDLEEVTMRMREVHDLLGLLLYEAGP
jgi:hypothetical protein